MKLKTHLPPILIAVFIAVSGLSPATSEAKQKRSEAAKDHFKAAHPCPANGNTRGPCPGYVIDHIQALDCGGPDDPSNMQWQTAAEGKAKDKWERKGCAVGRSNRAYAVESANIVSTGSYFTGAKGGCFTYSAGGKKRYVDHSYCR